MTWNVTEPKKKNNISLAAALSRHRLWVKLDRQADGSSNRRILYCFKKMKILRKEKGLVLLMLHLLGLMERRYRYGRLVDTSASLQD